MLAAISKNLTSRAHFQGHDDLRGCRAVSGMAQINRWRTHARWPGDEPASTLPTPYTRAGAQQRVSPLGTRVEGRSVHVPRWRRPSGRSGRRRPHNSTGRRRRPPACCPRPTGVWRRARPGQSSPCSWPSGTPWRPCAGRWCRAFGRRAVSWARAPIAWRNVRAVLVRRRRSGVGRERAATAEHGIASRNEARKRAAPRRAAAARRSFRTRRRPRTVRWYKQLTPAAAVINRFADRSRSSTPFPTPGRAVPNNIANAKTWPFPGRKLLPDESV